jgi:hypothetical protein
MKQIYTVFFLLLAVILRAQHHGDMNPDKPSVHGMLIFGKEKIYASHLPLFHSPHNYQIILELTLDKVAQKLFVKDQQQHPEFATYTIEPERFILPNKISSKGSFKANLYRGHFERGGIKIADSINLTIAAVLYYKKLDTAEEKFKEANYLLFGNSKEQFAIHQISNMPDFEQIIQVKAVLANSELNTVVLANENIPIGVSSNTLSSLIKSKEINIVLLKQLYLEFEDLKE